MMPRRKAGPLGAADVTPGSVRFLLGEPAGNDSGGFPNPDRTADTQDTEFIYLETRQDKSPLRIAEDYAATLETIEGKSRKVDRGSFRYRWGNHNFIGRFRIVDGIGTYGIRWNGWRWMIWRETQS